MRLEAISARKAEIFLNVQMELVGLSSKSTSFKIYSFMSLNSS